MVLRDLSLLELSGSSRFGCGCAAGATDGVGMIASCHIVSELSDVGSATGQFLAARRGRGIFLRATTIFVVALAGLAGTRRNDQPYRSEGEDNGSEGTIGKVHEI